MPSSRFSLSLSCHTYVLIHTHSIYIYMHTRTCIYIYDVCMHIYLYTHIVVPYMHVPPIWDVDPRPPMFWVFLTHWTGCNRQERVLDLAFLYSWWGSWQTILKKFPDIFCILFIRYRMKVSRGPGKKIHKGREWCQDLPPSPTFLGNRLCAEVVNPAPPEPSSLGRPRGVRRARRGATAPWSAASNCRAWAVRGGAPVLRGWVTSPWPEEERWSHADVGKIAGREAFR